MFKVQVPPLCIGSRGVKSAVPSKLVFVSHGETVDSSVNCCFFYLFITAVYENKITN